MGLLTQFRVIFVVFYCVHLSLSFRVTPAAGHRLNSNAHRLSSFGMSMMDEASVDIDAIKQIGDEERKELWKSISNLEREAVQMLASAENGSKEVAYKLLAKSAKLKKTDPFLQLAAAYTAATESDDQDSAKKIMADMEVIGAPPHIAGLASKKALQTSLSVAGEIFEDVDEGKTFSDTVTEKIRVKVSSFYDADKSDPDNGKYMFWYKVGIYNEGSEPVQIVARMWEIDKCKGEKEVVRGAGIMSTQPIIPPGDVFTYQSVCPLKLFPPKGKRILGSMTGAYTMCKGNMGQHNFTVKVGKFDLVLPPFDEE
jgi:ApaG protein